MPDTNTVTAKRRPATNGCATAHALWPDTPLAKLNQSATNVVLKLGIRDAQGLREILQLPSAADELAKMPNVGRDTICRLYVAAGLTPPVAKAPNKNDVLKGEIAILRDQVDAMDEKIIELSVRVDSMLARINELGGRLA